MGSVLIILQLQEGVSSGVCELWQACTAGQRVSPISHLLMTSEQIALCSLSDREAQFPELVCNRRLTCQLVREQNWLASQSPSIVKPCWLFSKHSALSHRGYVYGKCYRDTAAPLHPRRVDIHYSDARGFSNAAVTPPLEGW